MFDIGLQELVLIFVIALLVFGPKNLPQLGRSMGRAMREFRRASDEFRSTIETNLQINEPDPVPATLAAVSVELEPAAATALEPLPDSALDSLAPGEEGPPREAAPGAAEPASGEPYIARRGARLFHGRDCLWLAKVAEPERVYFKRVAEAREAGYMVCPVCEPWEPA